MISGLRISCFCVAVCGLFPTPAQANWPEPNPPDEVALCANVNGAYTPDLQIVGCTAAIQTGGYSATILATAYKIRGRAYAAKKDYDRAIVDFTKAIRIAPELAGSYNDRGFVYNLEGAYDRGIADYTEDIRLFPKSAYDYYERGVAHLYAGAPSKALADLKRMRALRPDDAYTILWLDIVSKRSSLQSPLSQAISRLDMTWWPAPVIRLFLGEMTRKAVLAAADDDPMPEVKKPRVCEAHFYIGELALQQGAKDEAARLFRLAAAGCLTRSTEFFAANAELKVLGTTP
jgi:lipoprotein NlpI